MAQGFAIAVRLIDLAAGPIGKINQAIAGIGRAVLSANSVAAKSVSSTSVAAKGAANTAAASAGAAAKKSSGPLRLIKDGLRDITRQTKEIGEGFLKAFTPIEALGLGGGIGGVIAGAGFLAQNFASAGASILRMSQSLGLNVIDLQTWRGAADLAGIGADSMTASLQGVSHGIYLARNGLNPELFRAAAQFGIDLNRGATDAQRAQNTILQVSDKIRNDPLLKGNVQAQQTLLSILGIDPKMLPLLQQGRVAIEGYIAEAQKHGYLTQQQAQQATALQRAYTGLTESITSTGYAIGAQIGQWLTPMLSAWSDWLDKLRATPNLLGGVRKAFEDIANADWTKVGENIAHALLGDGGKWQETGSRMLDFLTKGFNSAVPDFSEFVNKMTPIFANLAKGFGQAFAKDIEQAITDGIKNDPDLQTLIKVFEFPGRVHDAIFGPSGPNEDLRNRKAPGNWQEFWHNVNPFSGVGDALHGLKDFVFGKSDKEKIGDAVSAYEKLGWKHDDAVAIAANQFRESGLQNKTGDSGLAQGISQWHPDRQANFRRLFGHDIKDATLDEQYKFTDWELRNTKAAAGMRLRDAQGVAEKSAVVSRYYESPKDEVGEARERASLAARIENSLYPVGPAQAAVPPKAAVAIPPKAAVAVPQKPVGAPNVTRSPAGEMLVLPDVDVRAPAPDMRGKTVPIPPRVPTEVPGKQGNLGLDSKHEVYVNITGLPTGSRAGLSRADGPANVYVRTHYAMNDLS